jgi:hypothetical protein
MLGNFTVHFLTLSLKIFKGLPVPMKTSHMISVLEGMIGVLKE